MSNFSLVERSMANFELEASLAALFSPSAPWSEKDGAKNKVDSRRAHIVGNFKVFDDLYFPPEVYSGTYAPTNEFHARIAAACNKRGRQCTLIIGPHDHAKSATVYKAIIHAMLTGDRHFVGVVGETLETPSAIIKAVSAYLHDNARIRHDFPDIEFIRDNEEELQIRLKLNPIGTTLKAFSEGRSPRGKNVSLFYRFDLVIVEDLENRMSPMNEAAVQRRKEKLAEYQSAMADTGCLVMTANNFDERTVTNRMLQDQKDGNLDPSWEVLHFAAWSDAGALWPERYPAKSELELRRMLKPMDDATWDGAYQGKPRKPSGFFFKSEYHVLWNELPAGELVAATYVDPNLAKKGRGDRTCLGAMIYSPKTQLFYAAGIRYKSFSDSNELLDCLIALWRELLRAKCQIVVYGMDGNVNQESNWTQHIENYAARTERIFPFVEFKKYNVELIAKNAQTAWASGRVRFPESWFDADEAKAFTNDMWAFTGRKLPGAKDDGPDWFCCIMEAMAEIGIGADLGASMTAGSSHGGSFKTPFGRKR